jgi:hypothetical protein
MPLKMPLKKTLLAVVATVFGTACPAADSDFGPAKPVKDDGMVTRPQDVPPPPPDWASALIVVPAYDQATQSLTVLLKIKEGFHAYGPGEEVSKPVSMTVDATNGWAVDGDVVIPAGQKKDLGALGVSVILEGDVPLKARLKPGTGGISGSVEVQVCTDKACDRPKKHAFSIPG